MSHFSRSFLNSAISSLSSGFTVQPRGFRLKICMQVQPSSKARWTEREKPPEMDTWKPSRISKSKCQNPMFKSNYKLNIKHAILDEVVKSRHSRLSGIVEFYNELKRDDSGQAGMTPKRELLDFLRDRLY